MILDVFNKNFVRIVQIASYSYASYTVEYNGVGEFEVRIALDETAHNIMNNGKYILFEKDVIGIIEYFEGSSDAESTDELTIKGYLANCMLGIRCIPRTTSITGTTAAIVRGIVNDNCVEPTDSKRALPIVLSSNSAYIPTDTSHTVQVTGNSVQEAVENILSARNFGYRIAPVLSATSVTGLEFRVLKGSDRTIENQDSNSPVVFSTDLRNILSGEYTYNSTDYRNVAYVAGEGEGSQRTVLEAGSTQLEGVDRRETYVDARDLQSQDESGTTLTTAEYEEALLNRGLEQLSQLIESVAYEATVQLNDGQYKYGTDFLEGDLVTIQDAKIGIQIDAQVTTVQFTSYGERSIIDITFGEYRLSTLKKLQRKGVV